MNHAHALLDYWFGSLPSSGPGLEARLGWWFAGSLGAEEAPRGAAAEADPQRDAALAERFATLLERAACGELALWSASPRRRLALILLLDTLPRILHAGTPRAYAQDRAALELTLSGMQLGADAALAPVERIFFYLPLRHAESLEVQDESVTVHRRLAADVAAELRPPFAQLLAVAEWQRALIGRFGRFPQRNSVLRRLSSREERAWLREAEGLSR